MVDVKKNDKPVSLSDKTEVAQFVSDALSFTQTLKDFAITIGEPCPEGHRKDPRSGACLPMGSIDHTAETRSLNDEQGPLWRGEKDKPNKTFASKETALDASDMDEPSSCSEGTTFSFIKRVCVTLEEAEAEDNDEFAYEDEADSLKTEEEPRMKQPEGRRDTPNHECPAGHSFDYKRRKCIPLNKDTQLKDNTTSPDTMGKPVMRAAEEEGSHGDGIACVGPDPGDGHEHKAIVDSEGNGITTSDGWPKHSHAVKSYKVQDWKGKTLDGQSYVSRHLDSVNPYAENTSRDDDSDNYGAEDVVVPSINYSSDETAAKITTKQRKGLPDSSFGVPGKRKFPLDTCARVRNAMARFNQGKGLTSGEKATLRRKIMARAKACGIKVDKFSKASTPAEFAEVTTELILLEVPSMATKRVVAEEYAAEAPKKGPCPPGMEWDAKAKKCGKMMGFFKHITQADALKPEERPEAKQPEGRRDTPNHACPPGEFFDYKNRRCVGLNPAAKVPGTTTEQAVEDAAQRDLVPNPEGRPAKISQDCPPGTIWRQVTNTCIPLDPSKKIKSADETAGREGLVPAPEGKVKTPYECPEGHLWDGILKACRPIDSREKTRPGGKDLNPKDLANLSVNRIISELDKLIIAQGTKASASKVAAKDLPNAAFPPSLISSTKRSLMHHSPDVLDPYDQGSVDIVRLRNALARVSSVGQDFSAKAIEDAVEHLLYHAHEVLNSKKA